MNKAVVVDSNVFAKLFLKEEDSEQAENFMYNCLKEEIRILVPSLFLYEIIYISQKRNKNPRRVQECLHAQTNIEYRELTPELVDKSLELIEQSTHPKTGFPSFYDASYHALAILNDCDFITADKRHYEKTKNLGNIKLFCRVD